ncbi:hypothetical protein BDR04DRAFT_1095261, partial [Suillus decipiens]
DGDNMEFFAHAKLVFNHRFHLINTKYHTFALFLHPMCCKLAVTQVVSGRPFKFMVKVALEITLQWKWSKVKADTLVMNLKAYNLCHAPLSHWQPGRWTSLAFAIVILSIVPHAAKVKQLFSDLGGTQSAKCCNLSVHTFKTLGKVHTNLCNHVHL